jgi:hypothetical protein
LSNAPFARALCSKSRTLQRARRSCSSQRHSTGSTRGRVCTAAASGCRHHASAV